jgi:hypothetical protein
MTDRILATFTTQNEKMLSLAERNADLADALQRRIEPRRGR